MSTKLDKRSYLKTLRTQFYDKNNFNMITKLIGNSIKDNYNFNINKKDKEFILEKMKETYKNEKTSINKELNLNDNIQILNKIILKESLNELDQYYTQRKETLLKEKHKLNERPVSTNDNKLNSDILESIEKVTNLSKSEFGPNHFKELVTNYKIIEKNREKEKKLYEDINYTKEKILHTDKKQSILEFMYNFNIFIMVLLVIIFSILLLVYFYKL